MAILNQQAKVLISLFVQRQEAKSTESTDDNLGLWANRALYYNYIS